MDPDQLMQSATGYPSVLDLQARFANQPNRNGSIVGAGTGPFAADTGPGAPRGSISIPKPGVSINSLNDARRLSVGGRPGPPSAGGGQGGVSTSNTHSTSFPATSLAAVQSFLASRNNAISSGGDMKQQARGREASVNPTGLTMDDNSGDEEDEMDMDGNPKGQKSKRIGQACDNCHRNKKRCDGQKPCTNCKRAARSCEYTRSARKKESRAAYIVALESRLSQIEGVLSSKGVGLNQLLEDPAVSSLRSLLGNRPQPSTSGTSGSGSRRGSTAQSSSKSKKRRSTDLNAIDEERIMNAISQPSRPSDRRFSLEMSPPAEPNLPTSHMKRSQSDNLLETYPPISDSGGSNGGESDYDPLDAVPEHVNGMAVENVGLFGDDLALDLPMGLDSTLLGSSARAPNRFSFDLASYVGSTATPPPSTDVAMHPEEFYPNGNMPGLVSAAEVEALLGGNTFVKQQGIVGLKPLSGGDDSTPLSASSSKRSSANTLRRSSTDPRITPEGSDAVRRPATTLSGASNVGDQSEIGLKANQFSGPRRRTQSSAGILGLPGNVDHVLGTPFAPASLTPSQAPRVRTLSDLPLPLESLLGDHAGSAQLTSQFAFRNAIPVATGPEADENRLYGLPDVNGSSPNDILSRMLQSHSGDARNGEGFGNVALPNAKRRRMTEPSVAFSPFSLRADPDFSGADGEFPMLDNTLHIIGETPTSPPTINVPGEGNSSSRPSGGLPSSHLDFAADFLNPLGLDDSGRPLTPNATSSFPVPKVERRDAVGGRQSTEYTVDQYLESRFDSDNISPSWGAPDANHPEGYSSAANSIVEEFFEGASLNPSEEDLSLMNRLVSPMKVRYDLLDIYFAYPSSFTPTIHYPSFRRNAHRQNPLLLNSMYAQAVCIAKSLGIPISGPAPDPITSRNGASPATTTPDGSHSSPPLYQGVPDLISGTDLPLDAVQGAIPEADFFFARAKRLVAACMDEPCISSVVALVVLSLYAVGSGRPSSGWMYSGMAVRMAHELRLHKRASPNVVKSQTLNDREARNRVWWLCFAMDACANAIADRPTFVNLEEVTVALPDDELWNGLDDYGMPVPGSKADEIAKAAEKRGMTGLFGNSGMSWELAALPSGSSNALAPRFPSYGFREYVTLMKLFCRVLAHARARKAARKPSDNGYSAVEEHVAGVQDVGVLDVALNEWFASLPPHLREIGSVKSDNDVEHQRTLTLFCQSSFLHIVYYTTRILLHRPDLSVRNFSWPTQHSFEACTGAAGHIDNIIRRLSEVEPTFAHLNPFAAYCIFESGMVHLVNSIVLDIAQSRAPMPTANENVNANDLAQKAKASVRGHISALEKLTQYWVVGEAYLVNLKKLAAENRVFESPVALLGPSEVDQLISPLGVGSEMNLDLMNVDLSTLDLDFLGGVDLDGLAGPGLT
ncbi:hypothetical protein M427DRAFT_55790 [Gonapodya prolifera JEL478]|uniref:Zn(2)-C6 fungal-type domain-containing protein n=1 Tax=Gonapodya prolifera (strain JEL478) TaxID=1344416 RepID=A0A139AHS0_GONPJ|nr:hypothetical protein M427DRAFT_55790 [Gonapodya prolifera JEL478]|eukprot:KXS16372.1 hypothetical protein M427DRAFT_55790 [Gonapodya prolifera JEL478]